MVSRTTSFQKKIFLAHIFCTKFGFNHFIFTIFFFQELLVRESNETRPLPMGELTSRPRPSLDYCFVVLIQMGPTPTYKCYQDIKLFLYSNNVDCIVIVPTTTISINVWQVLALHNTLYTLHYLKQENSLAFSTFFIFVFRTSKTNCCQLSEL